MYYRTSVTFIQMPFIYLFIYYYYDYFRPAAAHGAGNLLERVGVVHLIRKLSLLYPIVNKLR